MQLRYLDQYKSLNKPIDIRLQISILMMRMIWLMSMINMFGTILVLERIYSLKSQSCAEDYDDDLFSPLWLTIYDDDDDEDDDDDADDDVVDDDDKQKRCINLSS